MLSEYHALTYKNYNKTRNDQDANYLRREKAHQLTETEVRNIRIMLENGFTTNEVAEFANVSTETVYRIKSGKIHKGVE